MNPRILYLASVALGAAASLSLPSTIASPGSQGAKLVRAEKANGFSGFVHLDMLDLSLEDYSRSASDVVMGTVVGVEQELPQDGVPHRVVRVATEAVLKGTAGASVDVFVPGGEGPGQFLRVSHAPQFRVGEQVLLFLHRDPTTGMHGLIGLEHGRYAVQPGANGRPRVDGLHARNLDLDEFLAQVSEAVCAQPR